jgi:hypothetical protein
VLVNERVVASFFFFQRTQGVGASLKLVLVNKGVVASLQLVPENLGSWCLYIRGLVPPSSWC